MSLIGVYDVTRSGKSCGSLTVTQDGIRTAFSLTADGCEGVMRLLCVCGEKYIPIGIPAPDDNILTLRKSFTKNALAEKGLTSIDGCILLPIGEKPPAPRASAQKPDAGASCEITADTERDVKPEEEPEREILPPCEDAPAVSVSADIPEEQKLTPAPEVFYADAPEENAMTSAPGWTPETEPWRLFSDTFLAEKCRAISGAMISRDGGAVLLALPFSLSKPFPLISQFRLGTMARLGAGEYVIFRLENGILTPYGT